MLIKNIVLLIEEMRVKFGRIACISYSYWHSLRLHSCGRKFRLRFGTVIISAENVNIGNYFESMGVLYLYAQNGSISVGDNVSINTNVQLGASGGRIVIGNNVLIAANVVMRAANHGLDSSELINKQPHSEGEIIIEDDVWIGSNVVITSNVTITKGTVVGAGAIVTKSTEPYSIVAGVPAKKIGDRS